MSYMKIFFLSKISKYFPPPHVGWHLFYLICGQSWLLLSTRLPNNSTTWQSFLATIIFTNNQILYRCQKKKLFWGESHIGKASKTDKINEKGPPPLLRTNSVTRVFEAFLYLLLLLATYCSWCC